MRGGDFIGVATVRGTWYQAGQPMPDRVGIVQIASKADGTLWALPLGVTAWAGSPPVLQLHADGAGHFAGWPNGITFNPRKEG